MPPGTPSHTYNMHKTDGWVRSMVFLHERSFQVVSWERRAFVRATPGQVWGREQDDVGSVDRSWDERMR